MSHSLWQLTLARVRLFFREPSAVFWTFGFPILMTVALGIAFRNRPPEPVAVVVEAGAGAEALAAPLRRDPGVRVRVLPEREARASLRAGRASLLVSAGPPLGYRFDPTRPESRLARAVVDDLLQRAAGRVDPQPVREERVTERGARYVDFLLPGLLGLNVMSSGMWGIAFVLVENRQKKLLKRLVATPMHRGEFLLSFVFVRMLFLLLEVPVLLGFGWLAFGVTIHGSLALFCALTGLGALAFAGLGLLIGARAQNTQTAGGLINLVMLPMFLLSGVFFPSTYFPDAMQPLVRALPLTALNDGLRAVMNDGAGPGAVSGQALLLFGVAALSFAVALRIFRWA